MSEQGGDPCRPIALRRRSQTLQSGGGAPGDFFKLMNHEPSIVREGGEFGELFASVNRPAFGALMPIEPCALPPSPSFSAFWRKSGRGFERGLTGAH